MKTERFMKTWLQAFETALVIVVEGHHYVKRVHEFLAELHPGAPRPLVLEITIPLPRDLHDFAGAIPQAGDADVAKIASVVALPVPWKTADGEIVSWMERTQTDFGWLWLTGHAPMQTVYAVHSLAKIGVHLSVGEAFSLVTMEHLVFHPTFALGRDGFHEDFADLVIPIETPEELVKVSREYFRDRRLWLDRVAYQRGYLRGRHTHERFRREMTDVITTAVSRWKPLPS